MVPGTMRDSDAVDEGGTVMGSIRLQSLYGHPWPRKPPPSPVDRTQSQRSEPESYANPVTGDLLFEMFPTRERSSLRIICPLLNRVLRQASSNPPSVLQEDDSFSPTLTIVEPYELLFHNRKRISQVAEEGANREHTIRHVKLLLDFIRHERPSTWEKLNELDSGNCRKIAFEDIWLIYPPGITVFAKDPGGWRAYKVERVESSSNSSGDVMLIHCLYLDLNTTGKWLTPRREVLTVRGYSSELPIGDLEVVPHWHFQRENSLSEKLTERGKKFWEYSRNVNHKEYYGQAWPRSSRQDPIKVVIDYVTSSKHMNLVQDTLGRIHSSSTCDICLGEALGLPSYPIEAPHDLDVCTRVTRQTDGEAEDSSKTAHSSLLFCPSRMWAFSLKHKSWEPILPEDLGDVQPQDDALDELIMKAEDKKRLESALITYRKDQPRKNNDGIARGSWGGFTILLYGNPGTGKTFTAECLAAKYGIPLYKITCADLGTDPDVLEDRLQDVCLRATNWKALLLLDEADMFIQARDKHNLREYAVVSTFLQHLDDSEALFFITSTRLDRLDQALDSRVTMPIHLPDISFEAQKTIWKSLIWRLENPSESQEKTWEEFIKFDLEAAEDGAYTTMNGRQINACIMAALALARKENSMVTKYLSLTPNATSLPQTS
ncbi:P-loop containing nucleoside triphosphate hydrolase protein [Xylaria cf. heliscus]|nr:P-loop containing nucleoside triphosphate hydrolase protein [Xylaria cf. heliscus]